MKETTPNKKTLHPSHAWMILTALVLVGILILNLLIQLIPSRFTVFDLTAQKITEISDITRDYLDQLEEDVVLYRLCVTGNEDQSLVALTDRYDQLSTHVSAVSVDPVVYPRFAAEFTDKELSDNSIIVSSGRRSKALDFNDLLLYNIYAKTEDGASYALQSQMNHTDFQNFYQTYSDAFLLGNYTYQTLFVGEDAITSAIDYVTSDVLPKVYLTSGHGEGQFPDSLTGYLSLDNIDCGSWPSLTDAVPQDTDCIVIYAPTQDFTAEEIAKFRDYLLSGGDMMLFTSYAALKLPNLLALMEEFGMKGSDRLVKETDSDYYQGTGYFLYPDATGARKHFSLASYTMLAPNCHTISMVESKYPMTYSSLFTTSSKAQLEAAESDENPQAEDAAPAEGDAEQESPAQPATGRYDVGSMVTLAGEGAGHLCWFASPDILNGDFNSAAGGGNYTYFLSILGELCEKNYSLVIESKVLDEDVLVLSDFQVGFWGVLLIAVIPLSALTAGLVIHGRRKLR